MDISDLCSEKYSKFRTGLMDAAGKLQGQVSGLIN